MTTTRRSPPASKESNHTEGEGAQAGSLFRVHALGLVALGGAGGGLIRAALVRVDDGVWSTLVVNLAGAFLLGFLVMYAAGRWRPAVLAGVTVGLLGALTTFSTLAGELSDMAAAGDWPGLAAYGAISVVGGLVIATFGVRLGRSRA